MKKNRVMVGLALLSVMSACSSIDVLRYDQLHPAEVFFPNQVRRVGVVNNMPLRSAPQENILTLGLLDGDGTTSTEALAGALADSKYFDEVIICDSALQSSTASAATYETKLSQEQVQALSEQLDVDMVVSFEQLWVQTSKELIQYPEWDASLPVLKAKYTPVVRLYVPERKQPLQTLNLTDSLFWNVNAGVSEKDVLHDAAVSSAERIANKMVPVWQTTERLYFTGGSVEMRDAAVWVREGEWSEAQKIWEELYNRLKKGSAKSQAAYNIALSYEMAGDMEKAIEWLDKAKKYAKKGSEEELLIKRYSERMPERIKQVSSLKMQMSRFQR